MAAGPFTSTREALQRTAGSCSWRGPVFVGLVPERLTWANVPGGRYEVWSCPELKPRFRVVFFMGGVEVCCHPHDTEIAARADFERRVEAKAGL